MKIQNRFLRNGVAIAFTVVLFAMQAAIAHAGPDDEYKKMPGYVDFDAMNAFGDREATVEVFLRGALLKMAIEACRFEEPELANALEGVRLVRVHVFDIEGEDEKQLRDSTSKVAKDLEKKGWEIAVRVREDDEQVYIYALPGKGEESIDGLVVMVVEDDDEAIFINIVGSINPEDIGRLGRTFDIDALDDMVDYNSDERERDRDRD